MQLTYPQYKYIVVDLLLDASYYGSIKQISEDQQMLELESINIIERRDALMARRKFNYDMSNVRFRRFKTVSWFHFTASPKSELLK